LPRCGGLFGGHSSVVSYYRISGLRSIQWHEGFIVIQFDAAPPVQADYPLLAALTKREIDLARAAGYVADDVDVREPILRRGLNNYDAPPAGEYLDDWRTRMYVIWFCFLIKHFLVIEKPLYAIEELVLEFKGLDAIDQRLAHLYAGVGGGPPISVAERERQLELLKPHYIKAKALLEEWIAAHPAE
jgi:hypothetical protein